MTHRSIPLETRVGDLVTEDIRTAPVLTRHGIDFCCKGVRTIAEVCRAQNIAPDTLIHELNEVLQNGESHPVVHATWPLDQLIDHIEQVHHRYVERHLPVLQEYLQKICHAHGERHPELQVIATEFNACANALAAHMKREELVLFPYIKQLVIAHHAGTLPAPPHFGTVTNPVQRMEEDHDAEGERFRRIAVLSNGYAIPPDACATYAATMQLLKAFERDLHTHVHLENNILFPQAILLEQEVRS
jgi:regulator of cell morphogenesis and NO signaling